MRIQQGSFRSQSGERPDAPAGAVLEPSGSVHEQSKDDANEGRWRPKLERLLHPRMRVELKEADKLGQLVVRALSSNTTEGPSAADEALKTWVQYRYTEVLKDLIKHTGGYKKWNLMTGVVIIVGGFATSGVAVAAGNDAPRSIPWVVFGFGLLVALSGALAQILKLGSRTALYVRLTRELRDEGWALVHGHGHYRDCADQSFELFETKVAEIDGSAEELAVPDLGSTITDGQREPELGSATVNGQRDLDEERPVRLRRVGRRGQSRRSTAPRRPGVRRS